MQGYLYASDPSALISRATAIVFGWKRFTMSAELADDAVSRLHHAGRCQIGIAAEVSRMVCV
jgi:hypothetical protein